MENIQAIACGLYLYVGIRQRLALLLYITPLIPLTVQMGVRHYSRLRVECHPRTPTLPMDDRGPYLLVPLTYFIASHKPRTDFVAVGRFIQPRVSPR